MSRGAAGKAVALVAVVVIIATLLLLTSMTKQRIHSGRVAATQARLRELGHYVAVYFAEHQELPPRADLAHVVQTYATTALADEIGPDVEDAWGEKIRYVIVHPGPPAVLLLTSKGSDRQEGVSESDDIWLLLRVSSEGKVEYLR